MTTPDESAFPHSFDAAALINAQGTFVRHGLSKREVFAAMAMQGFLSSNSAFPREVVTSATELQFLGMCTVACADALIAVAEAADGVLGYVDSGNGSESAADCAFLLRAALAELRAACEERP